METVFDVVKAIRANAKRDYGEMGDAYTIGVLQETINNVVTWGDTGAQAMESLIEFAKEDEHGRV